MLLIFALAYAQARHLTPRTTNVAAPGEAPLSGVQILGFVAALAAAYYLWGLVIAGRAHIPIIGLPSPDYLPQYATLFAIGILAFRREGAIRTLRRRQQKSPPDEVTAPSPAAAGVS